MSRYHRAITPKGDTIVIAVPTEGVNHIKHLYMWVDDEPLDLHPAMYGDTRLVEIGDVVACGGDDIIVSSIRPATEAYPRGQIRGDGGPWYSVSSAVLIGRK